MLFGEYDYETDIRVQRREAFEDGVEQAKIETAKNFIQKNIPLETIAECTGLPLEKVQELKTRESWIKQIKLPKIIRNFPLDYSSIAFYIYHKYKKMEIENNGKSKHNNRRKNSKNRNFFWSLSCNDY